MNTVTTGRDLNHFSHSISIALLTSIALFLMVTWSEPVQAGSSQGWMTAPMPATDPKGNSIPGCVIRFGSPNGPTDFPCASRCTGPAGYTPQSTAANCKIAGPGITMGDDFNFETRNPLLRPDVNMKYPYGKGPPGSTSCLTLTGNRGAPFGQHYYPKGDPLCGNISGDPHMKTLDGLRYDLMAAGEFLAVKSVEDSFQIQMRTAPWNNRRDLTLVTAVAAQVGKYRITITADTEAPLMIDGETVLLANRHSTRSEDGEAAVLHNGGRYTIVWQDGTNLHVDMLGTHIDLFLLPATSRAGSFVGLLGDGDGDDGTNDFRTRDGQELAATPEFNALYNVFGESWRISQDESLFDYGPGETTETFTDRDLPTRQLTLDDLDPVERTRAQVRCWEGGVTEPQALEQCIFDFGFTGDESFIASARGLQTPPEFKQTGDEVILSGPSEAFAAHKIEVQITGPVKEDYWVGFAPKGSANNGQAANPYSAQVTSGGDEEFNLVVPTIPGDYELRYRKRKNGSEILLSQPFKSVAPEITIEAPDKVPPGGSLEVHVKGDIGEHMRVTIVSAGSPDKTTGRAAPSLTQGSDMTRVIPRLPKEPGQYEIRCYTGWSKGHQIYARRPLTIE